MSTEKQRTAREIAEILRSFTEDLEQAFKPQSMPTTEQHEMRLRAIEAALSVLLNTLAEDK